MMGARSKTATKKDAAATRRVIIANRRGLHARAAAKFVKIAERYQAKVTVIKDGIEVSGGSIMGLMMRAAAPGTELEIRARGADAAKVLAALEELVAGKFDEED